MSDNRAKYEEIAEALRERIRANNEETLPSERELAREFTTTQMTVRRALTELEADGMIIRRPRRATQIVHRSEPIRVYSGHSEAVRRVIMGYLPERFPGESFEFLETEVSEAVLGSCDIIVAPTTLMHDYESHFVPLPDEMVERLRRNPALLPRAIDVHRQGGRYYGVPLLASAGAMQVNLDLLAELDMPLGETVSIPQMLALKETLDRRGDGAILLDPAFCTALVMHLILMGVPPEDSWNDASTEALEKGVDLLIQLMSGGMKEFASGQVLFRVVCRQSAVYFAEREDLPFPVRVMPLPAGSRWNGIPFSEALLVSRDHAMPQRLLEICESLLEPAAQEAIGKTRHGFPVLASARYNSLQYPVPGDDLFAFGLERCCFRQPPLLSQLRPVLWAGLEDVLIGAADLAAVKVTVMAAWRGLQLRHQASRRFAKQFGVVGGLGHSVA